MLRIIRNLLVNIVDNIDAGNSSLNEKECEEVIECLKLITDKTEKFSKYQACKYLGISRATFDNYVKEGKIPKGRKQQGFKELFFYRRDLDKYLDKYKTNSVI